MTVYVDDLNQTLRTADSFIVFCLMVGDDERVLHGLAAKIGVPRRMWRSGRYYVTRSQRDLAIQHGAVPVSWVRCAAMIRNREITGELGTPENAKTVFYQLNEVNVDGKILRITKLNGHKGY